MDQHFAVKNPMLWAFLCGRFAEVQLGQSVGTLFAGLDPEQTCAISNQDSVLGEHLESQPLRVTEHAKYPITPQKRRNIVILADPHNLRFLNVLKIPSRVFSSYSSVAEIFSGTIHHAEKLVENLTFWKGRHGSSFRLSPYD